MQLGTPTPQPHTPHPEPTTTSSVPSTATHVSVAGPPPGNLRRVRGPTLRKRVRRMISANSGSRLKVYVTQEMKTFCGENATKVSNELGSHIRRMCPVDGFIHSWKPIDPGLKAAIIQAVRDKFSVIEDDDEFTPLVEQVFHKKGNLIYKDWKWRMNHHYNELKEKRVDAYQHPFEGVTVDGWKFMIDHVFNDPKWQARKSAGKKNRQAVVEGFTVASRGGHTLGSRSIAAAITIEADKHDGRVPDFLEIYQATKTKKDGGWVDPQCEELHERMVAMRDAVTQSGAPLTAEEMSTSVLGEAKYSVRGLGVGRRPSSLSPNSNSAHQKVLKLQAEMELMREKRRIEREDNKRRDEEQREVQRRRDEEQREDQRRRDEEHQSRCDALQWRLEEFKIFKALMMKQMLGQDVGGSS